MVNDKMDTAYHRATVMEIPAKFIGIPLFDLAIFAHDLEVVSDVMYISNLSIRLQYCDTERHSARGMRTILKISEVSWIECLVDVLFELAWRAMANNSSSKISMKLVDGLK